MRSTFCKRKDSKKLENLTLLYFSENTLGLICCEGGIEHNQFVGGADPLEADRAEELLEEESEKALKSPIELSQRLLLDLGDLSALDGVALSLSLLPVPPLPPWLEAPERPPPPPPSLSRPSRPKSRRRKPKASGETSCMPDMLAGAGVAGAARR